MHTRRAAVHTPEDDGDHGIHIAHTRLLAPARSQFSRKLGPAVSIGEDVHLWSTAVEAVLQRMKTMHEELDLEDQRKTI